jgi:glycosyltransferase involved in cell wall biosynthesis
MAAGVPVVATEVDGTPEVVRDRRSGLLIPPDDPQAAAESILELIRDPELRGRCVDGGRRLLPDGFDIHRMVSDLERIYISLLDRW